MTRTMRNKPGPSDFVQLLSVTLIAGLYYVSTLATRPFIPLYAGELGATPVVLGLVVSMYAFLPIFIALPAGKFVDRFGPRPVMLGGASSMIVGSVFYLAAGNLVVLAGGQLLMGMGHTVLWMGAQATVIQIGTDSERDRNLGIFGFGTGLGQLSGPLLGGWLLDISGFHGVFLASLLGSAVTLLLIILLPATRRASGGAGESAQSGRGGEEADSKSTLLTGLALLRNGGMQVVITGSFISLFVTSAKQSFFPVWLESVGMTGVQIGMVTSVAGLASLAVRPMLPVLVRLLTRRGVLMGSLMLGITSIAVIPLFTSVWGLGAVSMAMGLACGLNQPMSLTLIANAVSDAQRGSAMGLRLLANRVAHVINPALMGVVVSAAGLAYGFWANAGFLVLALAFLHQRVVSHGFDHSLKQPGAVGGARGSG